MALSLFLSIFFFFLSSFVLSFLFNSICQFAKRKMPGKKSELFFAIQARPSTVYHEETLHLWLSKMSSVKILNRLRFAQSDLNLRWARMSKGTFFLMSGSMAFTIKMLGTANIQSLTT